MNTSDWDIPTYFLKMLVHFFLVSSTSTEFTLPLLNEAGYLQSYKSMKHCEHDFDNFIPSCVAFFMQYLFFDGSGIFLNVFGLLTNKHLRYILVFCIAILELASWLAILITFISSALQALTVWITLLCSEKRKYSPEFFYNLKFF